MTGKKSGRGRPKHSPQRMCAVCRTTASKRALTRLVRTENGVQIDPTGKQAGRGAYLCTNPACWQAALTGGLLAKALRVALTDEDRARLAAAAPSADTQIEDSAT